MTGKHFIAFLSSAASCEGKLTHLGIKAPSRSTLAYANEHRPWELYQLIFLHLLERGSVKSFV